jgi:16S rRNA (guanine966-N2)-methyltransferase
VRPTADRVRESLFARLGGLPGARVLDLFAGTGALGFEALSRGAANVVFVERSARVRGVLERNVDRLGLAADCRVMGGEARGAVARLGREGARFDLVLMDPPYASAGSAGVMEALRRAGILAPGGTVVLESSRRHPPGDAAGFEAVDERSYGDTRVVHFRLLPDGSPGPASPLEEVSPGGPHRGPEHEETA